VPFWGPHDGRQHFGVQIPPQKKPSDELTKKNRISQKFVIT